VAGAGSTELIWALARAFVGPQRQAVVLAPAFAEYAQAVRASGGRVAELRAEPPRFAITPGAALCALAPRPSVAFICRPSNPCLSILPLELLDGMVRSAPSTLFVLDEAYLPLFEGVEPAPRARNLVLLRSLTKLFALPGLRLGYLIAAPEVARVVRAALPPWNLSAPACAAGIAAASELHRAPAIARAVTTLRDRQARLLGGNGLEAAGGPFLLYRVGRARELARRLLDAGIRVRDASSFGLPEHLRIGLRPPEEQDKLARVWRTLG
jgi:histidinol-phosphate/aromatic aminotransferase/cobyric acid decarboxylase-like protein